MSNRLILGVDLQEGFLHPEAKKQGHAEKVAEYLAQQPSERILLTRFVNEPGNNFEKLLDYTALQQDDPQVKLIGDLERANYFVVSKSTYSGWTAEVSQRAKDLGASEVVVFGFDTEVCVLKTAFDVFEAGLRPIVLKDLCYSSNGQKAHETGIEIIKKVIGVRQVQ